MRKTIHGLTGLLAGMAISLAACGGVIEPAQAGNSEVGTPTTVEQLPTIPAEDWELPETRPEPPVSPQIVDGPHHLGPR